mmetsp:Transcript_3034/g.11569  ORF Transcript_3034/g.11569 Transcript_3034/m.11569 type:complete len:239 (+) Transcript_3034:1028-1744(+)
MGRGPCRIRAMRARKVTRCWASSPATMRGSMPSTRTISSPTRGPSLCVVGAEETASTTKCAAPLRLSRDSATDKPSRASSSKVTSTCSAASSASTTTTTTSSSSSRVVSRSSSSSSGACSWVPPSSSSSRWTTAGAKRSGGRGERGERRFSSRIAYDENSLCASDGAGSFPVLLYGAAAKAATRAPGGVLAEDEVVAVVAEVVLRQREDLCATHPGSSGSRRERTAACDASSSSKIRA